MARKDRGRQKQTSQGQDLRQSAESFTDTRGLRRNAASGMSVITCGDPHSPAVLCGRGKQA